MFTVATIFAGVSLFSPTDSKTNTEIELKEATHQKSIALSTNAGQVRDRQRSNKNRSHKDNLRDANSDRLEAFEEGSYDMEDAVAQQALSDYFESKNDDYGAVYWEELPNILEQLYQDDRHDEVRTRTITAEFKRIFSSTLEDASLINCDCGISVCKIKVLHNDLENLEAFNSGPMANDPLWSKAALHGTQIQLETGEIENTFYLSRNDNGLEFNERVASEMLKKLKNTEG